MHAINPVNGEAIPVWAADYVLMPTMATGAIMAVPAHDQRDLDFAKQYSIDLFQVRVVVDVPGASPTIHLAVRAYGQTVGEGVHRQLRGVRAGWATRPRPSLPSPSTLEDRGGVGKGDGQFPAARLGLFSRQRYWGAPIPVVLLRR